MVIKDPYESYYVYFVTRIPNDMSMSSYVKVHRSNNSVKVSRECNLSGRLKRRVRVKLREGYRRGVSTVSLETH